MRLLRVSGECEEGFDKTSANAHGGEAVRVRLLRVSGESEGSFGNTHANTHGGEAVRVPLLRVSGESEEWYHKTYATTARFGNTSALGVIEVRIFFLRMCEE